MSCVEKWYWEMGEIPSLQNPWLITQLKYRGDGSYGNNIISNLIINKYFSRDTLYKNGICYVCQTHIIYNPFYTFLYTHIIYNYKFCIMCVTYLNQCQWICLLVILVERTILSSCFMMIHTWFTRKLMRKSFSSQASNTSPAKDVAITEAATAATRGGAVHRDSLKKHQMSNWPAGG